MDFVKSIVQMDFKYLILRDIARRLMVVGDLVCFLFIACQPLLVIYFFYIYIKYDLKNTFCKYTQLNDQIVLFLTIKFSMNQSLMVSSIAMYN